MRISDWSSDVCSSDLPLSDDPYETENNWWSFNIPERKLGCWIHAPYYHNRNAVTWRIFAWDDEGYDQARMAYYRKVEEAPMPADPDLADIAFPRSEEHTSELQSLMRISNAVI